MKAILDEAGRIQLPEDVRSQLGLEPGDEVILESRAGEWLLRPAQSRMGLVWEGKVLVHRGAMTADTSIEELLDQARGERFRQLTDDLTP